ncbi:DUF5000 domain-containing lipoprotein [Chitinophaga defluvii]|uniref:DUF5000 domain-containing lipoprotein n=1 Tax=Chitinophaga defluvii TaxID=3163343 RepID=A0ABV2TCM6_9BACT
MNLSKYYIPALLISYLLIGGCKEKPIAPVDNGAPAPAQVTNITVERLAGGVKLKYRLPDDKNLQYVKVTCEINGQIREAKSSLYQNYLELKGFGDTTEKVLKVYSVNAAERTSEPVLIKVRPLWPPVQETFASLQLDRDFGGATVKFDNPSEADINIVMLTTDSNGDWVTSDVAYTKKRSGYFSVRGYDTVARKFAVYIKDRWDNRSDTLEKELVPVYEKQLDRLKFYEYPLPTDEKAAWNWWMPYLWDGIIVNNTNVDKPGFHTANGKWPQWFSFSIGVKAKLSRFRYWQRGSWVSFSDRNVKKFEIYGSNNPNPDGSWDSWTKLLEGESVKPSGLPMGTNTAEDLALIGAGEEFVFPPGTPAVKFIRIKVLETWSGDDAFFIMQVAFWGAEE